MKARIPNRRRQNPRLIRSRGAGSSSFALRQPALADGARADVRGDRPVACGSPDLFAKGGWLFIDLDPASDYAGVPGLVAKYAARIPPLAGDRPLFSALLFPVADDGVTPVADDAFREAELYDNGMARLVHGSQSEQGDSIQLAWDDEQIAEWFNRQVDRDGAGNLPSDAPLGVAGYRVDVRRQGDQDWNSLVRVESRGDLSLGPHQLGAFAGESVVEAIPIQVSKRRPSEYWMPSYFCSWRGSSLVLIDEDYRPPARASRSADARAGAASAESRSVAPAGGRQGGAARVRDDLRVPRPLRRPHARRARLHRAGARSARPLGGHDSVPTPQGPGQDQILSARRPPSGG